MRVLDVVDRVLVGLATRQVEVEIDRRVVRAREQVPAGRVDADLRDEVVERHELARALGHLCALARAHEVHELHDQQLQLVGVAAERLVGGLHPLRRSRGGRRPTRRSGAGSRARACPGGRRCPRRSRCARRSIGSARGPCRRRIELVRSHSAPSLVYVWPSSREQLERVRHRARLAVVQRALIPPVVEVLDAERRQRRLDLARSSRATAARPSSAASASAAPSRRAASSATYSPW